MGSYNRLHTKIACVNCHSLYDAIVQFKFGNTWQFDYRIGDNLTWGGNDFGHPGLAEVQVYGIREGDKCPICQVENTLEFDIMIKYDIISSINPIADIYDYLNSSKGEGEGEFIVRKE